MKEYKTIDEKADDSQTCPLCDAVLQTEVRKRERNNDLGVFVLTVVTASYTCKSKLRFGYVAGGVQTQVIKACPNPKEVGPTVAPE